MCLVIMYLYFIYLFTFFNTGCLTRGNLHSQNHSLKMTTYCSTTYCFAMWTVKTNKVKKKKKKVVFALRCQSDHKGYSSLFLQHIIYLQVSAELKAMPKFCENQKPFISPQLEWVISRITNQISSNTVITAHIKQVQKCKRKYFSFSITLNSDKISKQTK